MSEFARTALRLCAATWLACAMLCSNARAQSAQPTNNILFHTRMIKHKTEAGTMFSVQVEDRDYWLTAKHILTGSKTGPAGEFAEKKVSLDVLDPFDDAISWKPVEFSVIDPGKDIDIIVLVPALKLQDVGIPSLKIFSGDIGIGQECSFLGFPFANTWTATFSDSAKFKMPFIKHCYISGIIDRPISVVILDGINNPGFSGGPVLYHTGLDQGVIGVISGYHNEPGEVHTIEVPDTPTAAQAEETKKNNRTKTKDVVDLNSGIIIAYSVGPAVEAIKKNPIGLPVEAK